MLVLPTIDYKFDEEFFNPKIAPIINLIKEKDYSLFLEVGGMMYDVLLSYYKANKAEFTQEDMINCWATAQEAIVNFNKMEITVSSESVITEENHPFFKFINSIKPQLISFDVETENWRKDGEGGHSLLLPRIRIKSTKGVINPLNLKYK